MKRLQMSVALLCAVAAAGCMAQAPDSNAAAPAATPVTVPVASAAPKKWVCSADNMVSGSYSGGSYANIHLSPYSSGGSYRATKEGDTATGVTRDGTKFVCKEK